MIQEIKTLAEAEEVRKTTPHLYLISFALGGDKRGSTIIAGKTDEPLYRIYFMFNEVNKEKNMLVIMNIVKLS